MTSDGHSKYYFRRLYQHIVRPRCLLRHPGAPTALSRSVHSTWTQSSELSSVESYPLIVPDLTVEAAVKALSFDDDDDDAVLQLADLYSAGVLSPAPPTRQRPYEPSQFFHILIVPSSEPVA